MSQTEPQICYVCKTRCVSKEDKGCVFGFPCDSCCRTICKTCSGVRTATEIRAIIVQARACIFWCPNCKDQNLTKIQNITSTVSEDIGSPKPPLRTPVPSNAATVIENTYLKLLQKEMEDKNNILKSNNALLEQRIKSLESDLETYRVHDGASEKTEHIPQQSFENMFREFKERETRKQNYILFNCPETTTNIQEVANSVANQCLGRQTQAEFQVYRLGREVTGKMRPIRVICNSSGISNEIIRNSSKLKSNPNLKHLSISDDKTPQQVLEYRKLKQEMEERVKAGEPNLKIVYRNGLPKIVTRQIDGNLN